MHPRQANLLTQATNLAEKLAAKSKPQAAAPASMVLWKYVDADGKEFWLKEKRMTVKSPFSGKSFSAKPVRESPAGVGKDLRDEANAAAPMGAGPGSKTQTKRKKKADDEWKATSFEQTQKLPLDTTTPNDTPTE